MINVKEAPVARGKKVEINNENPYVLLCTYGTLRLGRGNYKWALQNTTSEYLGTFKTEPKFTMHGKGRNFPVVADNGNTKIECDVFLIKSPTILERIHELEQCTGIPGHPNNWYDIIEVETPWGSAYMYVQHGDVQHGGVITSGNWNNR